MGRFSKFFLWAIAGLVALFAVAAIAFLLFFDPNDFREDLEHVVRESTGRDLTIDGDVELQLFPWLAVEVGHATLGNATGFGEAPFAELERAQLSVKLLPLLFRQEIVVGKATLDISQLNLAVNRRGVSNWDDLTDGHGSDSSVAEDTAATESGAIDIAGVSVRIETASYEDQQSGSAYTLGELDLDTGAIYGAGGSGNIAIDGLSVKGILEGIASSPARLEIGTDSINVATGEQVITLDPVSLTLFDVDVVAAVQPFSYAGAIEPDAQISIDTFSPRSVMNYLDITPPETADPSALSSATIEASAAMRDNAITLSNLVMTLDDMEFSGSLVVPRGAGSYRFDLATEEMDLTRYMAPASEANGDAGGEAASTEIPGDLIRTLNASGNLSIAVVTLGNLLLEQVSVTLNSANGRMRIHPVTAGLYGGQYVGDISIDVTGGTPGLSFNEKVEDVDLARFAVAMFEEENITGTMRGEFKLAGRGNDTLELQRSLRGTMSFELADGTYEGTDVWYELRRARATLKQETPPEPVLPARTPFSSVTATGVVTDGVMRNDDLIAELPFMQLTGSGDVNLVDGIIDYGLRARVFDRPEALQEATPEEIEDLTKAVIPLRISGSLSDPKVTPDVEALLRQRVEEELKDKLEDKLKDIFNR